MGRPSLAEVRAQAGGADVRLVEETDYPFRGLVKITVSPSAAVRFPL